MSLVRCECILFPCILCFQVFLVLILHFSFLFLSNASQPTGHPSPGYCTLIQRPLAQGRTSGKEFDWSPIGGRLSMQCYTQQSNNQDAFNAHTQTHKRTHSHLPNYGIAQIFDQLLTNNFRSIIYFLVAMFWLTILCNGIVCTNAVIVKNRLMHST